MQNQKLNKLRLLLAFLIAVFLFVNIFLFAYSISFLKQQRVSGIQSDVRYALLAFNIEQELLKTCDEAVLEIISKDLDNTGSLISTLEERFGKHDERVLEQKQLYSIMEVQHFLNMQKYNKNCGDDRHLIFFFYSNQEDFEEEANKIGKILNSFKKQNKDVMIYSFDYDMDFSIIGILKIIYSVDNPNMVVFDEGSPFFLKNINDLSEHLN